MQVEVIDRPAMRIAAIRHRGPYPRISETFAQLDPIAKQAGLIGKGASLIAVYHDDPITTPVEKLRSDAGIMVSGMTKLPSALSEVRLAAGRYARATYTGPYAGLGEAWSWLKTTWLPESGNRAGDGPSYELYRNTPMNAAPGELVTDLYLPLR
jgi:AraC family transcriptional regulator